MPLGCIRSSHAEGNHPTKGWCNPEVKYCVASGVDHSENPSEIHRKIHWRFIKNSSLLVTIPVYEP
jgi:hypothetical protein